MNDKINTGGAFHPLTRPDGWVHDGLSIRDWFAGMALQGEISTQKEGYVEYTDNNFDRLASYCYKIADAMLQEREIKE